MPHEWTQRDGIEFCLACLVVRRADDRNKPCRGPARLSLRDAPPVEEIPPPRVVKRTEPLPPREHAPHCPTCTCHLRRHS